MWLSIIVISAAGTLAHFLYDGYRYGESLNYFCTKLASLLILTATFSKTSRKNAKNNSHIFKNML
jgi:hypothetical protein